MASKAIDLNLSPAEIKRQVLESIEREQGEKKKQAATKAEAKLDQRARESFFAAQPGASEEAYQEIAGDLKRQLQVNDALDHDRNRLQLHSIYGDM